MDVKLYVAICSSEQIISTHWLFMAVIMLCFKFRNIFHHRSDQFSLRRSLNLDLCNEQSFSHSIWWVSTWVKLTNHRLDKPWIYLHMDRQAWSFTICACRVHSHESPGPMWRFNQWLDWTTRNSMDRKQRPDNQQAFNTIQYNITST